MGILELSTAETVGADKVRVAKLANSGGPICLSARPKVAAGKSTKNSGPT
jgi:hypothetical protein